MGLDYHILETSETLPTVSSFVNNFKDTGNQKARQETNATL